MGHNVTNAQHKAQSWRQTIMEPNVELDTFGSIRLILDSSNAHGVRRALDAAKKEWESAITAAEWGLRRCEIMIEVWERESKRAIDALANSSTKKSEQDEWLTYQANAETNLRKNAERRDAFAERMQKAKDSLKLVEEQRETLKELEIPLKSPFEHLRNAAKVPCGLPEL